MRQEITSELAEMSEAELMYDVETSAPEHVRALLGISSTRIGDGVVLAARTDPSNYWSKALGFGFATPVTRGLISDIVEFYRAEGVTSATLQLAPSVLPDNWSGICDDFGLKSDSAWVKLAGTAEQIAEDAPYQPPSPSMTVRAVEVECGQPWAATIVAGFGLPEVGNIELLGSLPGRAGWHAFAAWSDGELIAGGSMRAHRDTGHFFGAATLAHARRRGAQTVLLAYRARAARDAGSRWLVSETGAEAPGEHNSSLHNMIRAGFSPLYQRQNWVWQA
jgi:GNAT superfamily N-acetyltransferase